MTPSQAREVMRAFNFATVVTHRRESRDDNVEKTTLEAAHLPVIFREEGGDFGTVVGHLARANPLADLLADRETLIIFHGEHGYISPTWYQTHRAVPTWNYRAVHAYGTPRLVTEKERLYALVQELAAVHERDTATGWALDQVDDAEFLSSMLGAIVGFEMPITRLEAKAKMSQNRPLDDRKSVVKALEATSRSPGLVAAMREHGAFDDTPK